jgi:hypothetical protein
MKGKKTVVGISKDEMPIDKLCHFSGTLKGVEGRKKKS